MKGPNIEFVNSQISDEKTQWHWRLTARNGKILASSEIYSSFTKCAHGVMVAMSLSRRPGRYEFRAHSRGGLFEHDISYWEE